MFRCRTSFQRTRSRAGVVALAIVLFGHAPTADADEAWGDRVEELPQPESAPQYLRTTLEELGFLGFQTAWYWGHSFHGNEKFNWHNWRARLTSTHDMVLDDDKFRTGAVGHPIAGAGYYLIARGNGFGAVASFAITVLASTTWQYFSEWNEKPATNDLLITPVAGWAIGEASFRLGQYFIERGPGVFDCVGAALFSPVATYNDPRPCRFRRGDAGEEEDQVHRPDLGHRFDLSVGTAHSTFGTGETEVELELGGDGRLTTHRLYQRPGTGRSTARPGQWTTLATDWLLGHQGAHGGFFHADSIALGDYRRRYDETADSPKPDGWGRLLAIGSSYDYASRALPVRWDRVMSVGIAGPLFEIMASHHEIELRAKAALYYGFAQVTSLAYPDVAQTLSGQAIRTVLLRQGYYYAQAILPSAEIEAAYGRIRLTLAGRGGEYWSINGDDSHQSQLTNRFSLRDERLRTTATLAVRPEHGPFRLALGVVSGFWKSRLLGHTFTAREESVVLSIQMGF